MKITKFLKDNLVFLDGGMGTLLQKKGLPAGELPEKWNLERPEVITEIHKQYFESGSNIVSTNTFEANILKFSEGDLESIIKAAIDNARCAAEQSAATQPKWVALDIGPTGRMLSPLGDLAFEDAVEIFAKTVRLGAKHGADLIFIETMNDSYETKAALLAAKENCDLPVFVSNAYNEDGCLMTGASPAAMVAMLEGLGADAIGVNCSLGPKALMPIIEQYLEYSSLPVLLKPNAGLPVVINGETRYNVLPDEFANEVLEGLKKGVRLAGGCCGTTPEYITALTERAVNIKPVPVAKKDLCVVSSYAKAVFFGNEPILIGERINPTGKKRFKQALVENDIDYILNEGIAQQEKGVHILDVNVGLPEIDEKQMLCRCVKELQAVIDLPLQLDTSSKDALEAALRIYNGKPLINSVNGKKESMQTVFPLAKKYGGVIIALTLDEKGIPETAEERLEIAKRILESAKQYGIDKKDIIFDPLALTISADDTAAEKTLLSIKAINETLGCKTSLGVSNVSFGLPGRDIINSTFFALALSYGLRAAIMNPYSSEMMKTYYSYCALSGLDKNCLNYIGFAENLQSAEPIIEKSVKKANDETFKSKLQRAIIKGLRDEAVSITEQQLSSRAPLDIINEEIIPALNIVGKGFEEKRIYLPSLLMSAEAAKSAAELIKEAVPKNESNNGATIVIATVKGDIHDIGKNIVKLLLQNYGFNVIDLGKDVDSQTIVDAAIKYNAKIVGLSALMTTTVPSMQGTITLLKESGCDCKVMVGGAVLNEDYAKMLGADKYAPDAMEAVRYAQTIK